MASFVVCSASLAVASFAGSAQAYTLALTSYQSTAAFPSDTRLNGSATDSSDTIDGVHTTVLLTSTDGNDGQEKVAPFFYTGALYTPLGTLGDLSRGSFKADWRLNSTGPLAVAPIAAFRILVDGPTIGTVAELIWETAYQTSPPTATPGVGIDNLDIGSGKFWSRFAGQNYGQGDNGPPSSPLTLAQLAAGGKLTPSAPTFGEGTKIYGVQVSVGSAAGTYSANVGDINMTFDAAPAVPLPAAAWGGMALLGGLGALRRRFGAATPA